MLLFWGWAVFLSGSADEIHAAEPGCSNLNVAILGDSMTWIGGDDCENPVGWTYYFKKELKPASIYIYARSGATITNTVNTHKDTQAFTKVLDDDNVIYNQAERLKEDLEAGKITAPDLVIIYAGANDAWFTSKRPGSYDTDLTGLGKIGADVVPSQATSLGKSLALSVKIIRQILPLSRILIVTPLEMSKVSAEKIHNLSDAIETVASRLGCDVIRADREVDVRHSVEKRKFTYTKDGVHTNEKGAALLSESLSNYVKLHYCK